jgi:glycosyltransferase involved in cell wall biosynthesis
VKVVICSKRGALLRFVWLDRLTQKLVTCYTAQTAAAKADIVSRLGISPTRCYVIPNGLNLHDFELDFDHAALLRTLSIPSQGVRLICVGNLKPGKGHDVLLEAFNHIWQSARKSKPSLLLVGEGPLRSILESQVQSLGCRESVFFLGRRTDVKELLAVSDIFVLPTLSEGMSNALLEAMASRLAIVTTAIPVNQELLQSGHEGLLVPPQDQQALQAALVTLVKDQPLRQKMGQAAYKVVREKYQLSHVARRLAYLYEELLG